MKLKKIILISIICLLTFSTLVYANNDFYEKNINLDLRDVELDDAFRTLAEIADLNVVIGENVNGRVRVNLKDIAFIQAIELLTKPRNLSYRIMDNTMVIDDSRNLRGFDEKITKVFELKNNNPQEVRNNLETILYSNYDYSEEVSIDVNENLEGLVITTFKDKMKNIEKIIGNIDKEKKQIMLQVMIQDISRTDIRDMGIDWSFGDLIIDEQKYDEQGNPLDNKLDFGVSHLDFSSIIDVLEESGNSKILANPQIATLDGQEASIVIGDRVPIRRNTSDEENEVDFEEVGIILNITPKVLDDGKIRISAQPEVSSTTGYEGNMPIISTRNVDTNIRVKDGKTIAIGGLIQNEEIENIRGIPYLKDIPYAGRLFSTKKTDIQQRELMIFITPKIIGDEGSKINFKKDDNLKSGNELLKDIEKSQKEMNYDKKELENLEKSLENKNEKLNNKEKTLISKEQRLEQLNENLEMDKEKIIKLTEQLSDKGINIENTSLNILEEMVEELEVEEKNNKKEEKNNDLNKEKENNKGIFSSIISIFKF